MKINFENEFSERILDRGYNYYKNNCVQNVIFKDDLITADVIGTETYSTYIKVDNNTLIDIGCDCPYANDGNNCKHIVALLYYVNEENVDEIKNNNQSKEQNLHNIIKQIDKTELEKFLVELLSNDNKIYDKFRLKFNKLFPNLTLNEYKKRIYEVIITSAGRDGFIDYYESWNYTRGMQSVTSEVEVLVENQNFELAFEVAICILETIPKTDIDDSNGSIGEVSENCIEIIVAILEQILNSENNLSREILEYILDELRTEYLANYGIELYGLLNYYIEEDIYIKEIETALYDILKDSKNKKYFWKTEYYVDMLINIYNKENNDEKIMNLLVEYSDDQDTCLKLVDRYLKQNDIRNAIKLLKKNLKENSRIIYANKLSEIYLKENMTKEYKSILYKILYELDRYNITVYKKIKELYSKRDWLIERQNIINKIKSENNWYCSRLLDIYIEEKMYDDVYRLIKDKDVDTIMKYEQYLLPKYNKKILKIYIKHCKEFAEKANTRKLYRQLARYLSHIKNMENSKEEYKILIEEIKMKYINKPAMQEELKNYKL